MIGNGGLRILHLMSCRGWSSDAYWAGETVRGLEALGHRVTLVAREGADEKVLSRLRARGLGDIRTLAFRGRHAPMDAVRDLRSLRRLLSQYDLVHVHRGKEHWLAALASLGSAAPVPIVRTRHIVNPVRCHPLNRWLYRRATRHVVAVSETIRQRYIASGLLPADRVTALPGGVDHQRFHLGVDGTPFRVSHGIPPDAVLVGILGGLRPLKGHAVFLRAARAIVERHPAARFVMVGAGGEAARVRDLVRELGLERTVLSVGYAPAPEQALAAFDVAVYAAVASEGMGRVLFEYMAAGCPIVASAVGLGPEVLVHEETALLVHPGETGELVLAIERLLREPDVRARLGRRARRLVEERYSAAQVSAALERVYLAVLAAPRRRNAEQPR